ncbi:MAG TPA: phosphate ABC transporter substrate-binding protein PstS [Caulobacteraceae bacterium]|nr:phosphate ABC transporter substrate-binding protein PstS [Caulobacteraceae bacterium]
MHRPSKVLVPAIGTLALALTLGLPGGCRQSDRRVEGAGATFPAPLYAWWATAYRPVSGVTVEYQAIGSGGGIQRMLAKTVDFGATGIPLTPARLSQAGLYQFPTVVGGVTPIVNLPGIAPGQLKLSGPLLADIFLGGVTRWSDPRIAALNPRLKLPADRIVIVHRSDSSGSTFLVTSYLSLVSPAWKARVGAGGAVAWPTGLAADGARELASVVRQHIGAIGYVEFGAFSRNFTSVQLQDRDGLFIAPSPDTFAAAAGGADWAGAEDAGVLMLNAPGTRSWPITGASFVLVYRRPANPAKTRLTLAFFDWAFRNGDAAAARMGYAPLSPAVKDRIRRAWAANITDAGGRPLYASAP